MKIRSIAAIALAATLGLGLVACDENPAKPATASDQAQRDINASADARAPYVPQNDVEFDNYNKAQELYDDPASIIWCTTTWGNASAPMVTIPIAGKLTSSSVSYYPNHEQKMHKGMDYGFTWSEETRSVDGMYHGSPGPYRYGFTPGGQYVDFTNLEVLCTTALTEFQRQNTTIDVQVDTGASDLQQRAEAALEAGDQAGAEALLEELAR